MQFEMDGRKEIIDTCGTDTTEWQEAQVRYQKSVGDLETQISLCSGFECLGDKLDKWGDGRK